MNRHASRKKESYLYVKQPMKSGGKSWKKKWVAVRQNKSSMGKSVLLELYQEREAYNKPVISVLVEGVDSITRIPAKTREHAFDIKSGEKILLGVATDSESQTYEWFETFRRLLLEIKPELTSLPEIGEDFCKVSIIPNKVSERLGLLGDYYAATNAQMKVSLYETCTGEMVIQWDMHHLKKVLVTTKCNVRDKEKIMHMVVSDRSEHGKGELLFFSQKAKRLADTIFETLSGAISVKSRQTRSASMIFEITPKDLKRMMQQRDPDSESMASIAMDGIKYGIEEERVQTIPEVEELGQEDGDWVIVQKIRQTADDDGDNKGSNKESKGGVDVTLHNGDSEHNESKNKTNLATSSEDAILQNGNSEHNESTNKIIIEALPELPDIAADSEGVALESKEHDSESVEEASTPSPVQEKHDSESKEEASTPSLEQGITWAEASTPSPEQEKHDNENAKEASTPSLEQGITWAEASTPSPEQDINSGNNQSEEVQDIFKDVTSTDNKEEQENHVQISKPGVVTTNEDINCVPFPDIDSSKEGSTNHQAGKDTAVVESSSHSDGEVEDIFATPVDNKEGGKLTVDLENSAVTPDVPEGERLDAPDGSGDVKDFTQSIQLGDTNHQPSHVHDVSTDSGFINDAAGDDTNGHITSINKNNNNSRESLNCMTEEECKDRDESVSCQHEDGNGDVKDNERLQPDVLPEFGLPVDVADLEEISVIVYNEDSQEVLV